MLTKKTWAKAAVALLEQLVDFGQVVLRSVGNCRV